MTFIWFLAAANLAFYVYLEPLYSPLLLMTSVVSYFAALAIDKPVSTGKRRATLFVGLVLSLLPLAATKYGLVPGVELSYFPLGISFYTFCAIGYVLDVYFGRLEAQKNFAKAFAFISFFPLITAGPIERAGHLFPQFERGFSMNYERIRFGFWLIALGIFKKYVIAENLNVWVAPVYQRPEAFSGGALYLATMMVRYQIFADFSGYTDMARGAAKILGIDVMENFRRPFASVSIVDHWRRWHISLSSWIRDYVFMPLVTSRAGNLGLSANIIITFVLLGLWHGGTLNFAVYGLIQGVLIAVSHFCKPWREKTVRQLGINQFPVLLRTFQISFTFCVLVVLPTVFFRAHGWEASMRIFSGIFSAQAGNSLPIPLVKGVLLLAVIAAFEWLQMRDEKKPVAQTLSGMNSALRWSVYTGVFFLALALGKFDEGFDFVYRHF